jgi:hypothetical protein
MSHLYRPRQLLRLSVPVPRGDDIELITYDLPVIRARHVRNDHNHADELSVTVDWVDAGVDPRWIAGATCEYYLDDANEAGDLEPSADNVRFVGRMVKPSRRMKGDSLQVDLEFHDYTSFFLLAKPFASDGVPLYAETLGEAWARICEHTPGAEPLAGNIELRGLDTFPQIGSAVAERFRKRGSLHVKPDGDAWSIWQQCVGMMGLISFFELDTCIVTTATDLYTAVDPPRLIYGRNILDFTEERNNDRQLKGVGITSFNPITGQTLEALYNPLAGNKKKIKPAAKRRRKPATVDDSKEYDVFSYPGLTEQAAVDAVARRVYEERSRQELEGTLTTVEMSIDTASGATFDLLLLGAGDTIEVKFLGDEDAAFVKSFTSRAERVQYLLDRGYSEPVAQIIAGNVDALTSKSSLFYVKSVTTELESSSDGSGSFRLEIAYCNKIDPKGGAELTPPAAA